MKRGTQDAPQIGLNFCSLASHGCRVHLPYPVHSFVRPYRVPTTQTHAPPCSSSHLTVAHMDAHTLRSQSQSGAFLSQSHADRALRSHGKAPSPPSPPLDGGCRLVRWFSTRSLSPRPDYPIASPSIPAAFLPHLALVSPFGASLHTRTHAHTHTPDCLPRDKGDGGGRKSKI